MKKTYIKIFLVLLTVIVLFIGYKFIVNVKQFGPGLADFKYRIARDCELSRSSAFNTYVGCQGMIEYTDSDVFKVGWNDQYLIAATHPVTKMDTSACRVGCPDQSLTYWWIIDMIDKSLHGPIKSDQDFDQQKQNLKIDNFELWSINEAKERGVKIN